jgi:hypothetical protein
MGEAGWVDEETGKLYYFKEMLKEPDSDIGMRK